MSKEAKRTCGGCTACCFLPAVRELEKPTNTWCTHCAIGTGCKIYKQRPQGCRDFQCLWLRNPSIPDELRPDKIGVVFEPFRLSKTCLAMVDPAQPNAWQGPAMQIITNLLCNDVAVVITCGDNTNMMLPRGRTTKQVIDDVKTELEIVA